MRCAARIPGPSSVVAMAPCSLDDLRSCAAIISSSQYNIGVRRSLVLVSPFDLQFHLSCPLVEDTDM